MTTPWDRAQVKSGAARAKLQESTLAKRPDMQPQVNSGRIWSSLRDLKMKSFIGRFLVDAKDHSESLSYRVTRDDWRQLKRDANRTPPGCLPALQIDIQDIHLFVVELSTWDEVTEYMIWLEARVEELEERAKNQA